MLNLERWWRRFGELLFSSRSVSATYIHSMIPAGERYGLDAEALMREAGLDPAQVAQPGHRVPLFHAFRLAELAAERSGDPCFGLEVGKTVRAKSFQVLGYSAMSCRTLGEAVERLRRYEKLVWDIGITTLSEEDEVAVLEMMPEGISLVPDQVIEMAICGWVSFGRWILREPQPLLEVRFRHARIGPLERYEEIFECPVLFEQNANQIRFPNRVLHAPLMDADAALLELMDQQGEKLLAEYAQETNIINEVRAQVCRALQDGDPDIAAVAAQLGLTSRGLRRRLDRAGSNFQSISDGVRRDLALNYLNNTELGMLDVAFLLGFSDQSAFNRAFRRWTGQAPGQYKATTGPK